jgi:hypothetical protein
MATHSAQSLFDQNVKSAEDCLELYDGVRTLKTSLQIDWILRAAVVFVVSALDAYFHDKIRYRVGRYSLENLPPNLAKFEVPLRDLVAWDGAQRKGNVLRNWVMDDLAVKPLQSPSAITDALKLAGIDSLWDTIEPDKRNKAKLLEQYNALIKRRNQIGHEGDRMQSRKSGKKLRPIARTEVAGYVTFAKGLVGKIEGAFPR